MLKVFAAYYKQIGGGRSFLKFFETRQDAERMYQYEFGFLGGIKCSVFRNKCLFLNKKEITINSRDLCNIILRSLSND